MLTVVTSLDSFANCVAELRSGDCTHVRPVERRMPARMVETAGSVRSGTLCLVVVVVGGVIWERGTYRGLGRRRSEQVCRALTRGPVSANRGAAAEGARCFSLHDAHACDDGMDGEREAGRKRAGCGSAGRGHLPPSWLDLFFAMRRIWEEDVGKWATRFGTA